MTRSKWLCLPALVAGTVLGVGSARADEPTASELRQQIQQLQSKVEQLETKQNNSTADKVMADAESRSQLMQPNAGFTAGWTPAKGFVIQDEPGNWVLHPFAQFQFRDVLNVRQSTPVRAGGAGTPITSYNDNDDIQNGFELRRMKLGFDGKAFDAKLSYYLLWATSSTTGGLSLEQAWVKYGLNDSWAIRGGQIRNPVFHEQDTSSSKQLAGERTLINQLITGSSEAFTQAVSAIYEDKGSPVLAEFGVSDGFVTGNTDFQDTPAGNWGAFGRVNYFLKGNNARSEYSDFTAMGNKEELLVLGGGLDLTQTGDTTNYRWTADAQWENTKGLGIYAAVIGNFADNSATTTNSDVGILAEAGYMLNDKWEVFGRGAIGFFDTPNGVTGEDVYSEFTIGANWYIWGSHAAKFTVDLTILPNGAPEDFSTLSVLASDDLEAVIRAQFQLLL